MLSNASVLVVDDDALLRRAVVRMLVDAGACVCSAADGDQAIAIATTEHVDLLLTDMDMPGRDGAAVALAVTAIRPDVAVVFMSGRSREHLEKGRLAADACLVEKPFTQMLLVTTLADALASSRDRGGQRC